MFVNIFSKTIFNAVAVWGHCAEMNVLSFISVNKCSSNTDAISTCRFVLHYIKLYIKLAKKIRRLIIQ